MQVKWNKNGHEVKFDDRVKAVTEGTTYKLVITDARLDDAEQYIITLPDGMKSKAILKVDGIVHISIFMLSRLVGNYFHHSWLNHFFSERD